MMQHKTTIFTHIPKVAGTSLSRRLIFSNHPRAKVKAFRGIRDLISSRNSAFEVLIGHNPYGMSHFCRGDCRYFTVLRDPVERAISHYYFIKQPAIDPAKAGNFDQKKMHQQVDLKDIFVKAGRMRCRLTSSWLVDNMQTRYTAGYLDYWRHRSSARLLSVAKRNLKERFAVFGLQNRFEETLQVVADAFDWEVAAPVKHEKATRIEKDFDEVDLEAVVANNQLDLELFNYAQELFRHRYG